MRLTLIDTNDDLQLGPDTEIVIEASPASPYSETFEIDSLTVLQVNGLGYKDFAPEHRQKILAWVWDNCESREVAEQAREQWLDQRDTKLYD